MIQIIFAALSLPLCVVLMQFHGVAFWTWAVTRADPVWGGAMLAAPWNGWGWSIMLEIVNLWAWARVALNRWKTLSGPGWVLLATTTTALLVAGPLYRVATPLYQEIVAAPVSAEATPAIENIRGQIRALESEIAIYRDDWRLRPLIEARGAVLQALYGRLDSFIAENAASAKSAKLDGLRAAVIAGQLAAIIVAQLGAVLAIVTLFGGPTSNRPRPSSEQALSNPGKTFFERSPADQLDIRRALIRRFALAHGLRSQNTVAEKINEPRSTLSEYVNGRTRRETSGRITTKLQPPTG